MRPSTDGPLFLTYTCDWTVNQPTNLLVLCPFSYSTLLCSALLCYSYNNNYYYYKTTSCLYSSPARVIGLVGRRTSRSVPRRNRLFERSSEPAVICTLPALALATLGLLPALLTTQRLLVALSLAQPSPAQPLKQSINHSLLALAPRRRLSLAPTGLDCYCTSRTKGDGKPPLYTSPLLAKTATLFGLSALKLN